MPPGVEVVLLAERGFADGKLMKYLLATLGWHFRIRIKRSFYFEHQGQWRSVRDIKRRLGASLVRTIRALEQDLALWHGASSLCPRQA